MPVRHWLQQDPRPESGKSCIKYRMRLKYHKVINELTERRGGMLRRIGVLALLCERSMCRYND